MMAQLKNLWSKIIGTKNHPSSSPVVDNTLPNKQKFVSKNTFTREDRNHIAWDLKNIYDCKGIPYNYKFIEYDDGFKELVVKRKKNIVVVDPNQFESIKDLKEITLTDPNVIVSDED